MKLDRVAERARLKPRRDPYWQRTTRGRYVGFRRMTAATTGTWLARYYDGQKYAYSTLGDFADKAAEERYDLAKASAEEWFGRLDLGGSTDKVTVKAACEAYVENLKQEKSEASAVDAKGRFERLVYHDPIAKIELAKLKRSHVDAWRTRALKAGGSKGSFNRNATTLRAALNFARKNDLVTTDHAWREHLKPFENATTRRTLYLDGAARRKLIENAPAQVKPLLRTLALLPMRVGEVAALKVENLDRRNKVLSVPAAKTKAREVPLGSEAFAHLESCARNKLPGAWLVARADGSQWKKEVWRDEIKAAARKAKLPRATVAYTLRHSTVTDLLTGGLDTLTVARISGTSLMMIEKHYGHLRMEHARDALEKLALA